MIKKKQKRVLSASHGYDANSDMILRQDIKIIRMGAAVKELNDLSACWKRNSGISCQYAHDVIIPEFKDDLYHTPACLLLNDSIAAGLKSPNVLPFVVAVCDMDTGIKSRSGILILFD